MGMAQEIDQIYQTLIEALYIEHPLALLLTWFNFNPSRDS